MMSIITEKIADGVNFSQLTANKFKTNRISVNFIVPMDKKTVSANALLSYVMRLGCRDYPDFTELNKKLDELYGAGLGTDTAKIGANQIVNFSVAYMDDRYSLEGENLTQECCRLLLAIIFSPLIEKGAFSEAQIQMEKENLMEAIRGLINDKRSYAVAKCLEKVGRGDPAYLLRYGSEEDVKPLNGSITAIQYEEILKTAQVEIFCTGGGDFKEIKESMRRSFGAIRRNPLPLTKSASIFPTEEEIYASETMEVSQAKLVMAFRPIRVLSQNEQNSMRVMSALFGGTPASKLFLNVREKLSLCYYCSASYNPLTSLMVVDSGVENKNAAEAQKQILIELDKIRNGDFTEDETDKTKKLMINALNTIEDSQQSMEEWYLRGIIEGVSCTPDERIENILRVTHKEIADVANLIKTDGVFLLKGGNE